MRSDVDITNFTAGELSPRMKGRIDHKSYFNALDTCLNMVVMPQGGATERPGTLLAAKSKNQAARCKLVPFIFSTLQAYQLEFSNGNVRVYKDRAPVLNMGTPVDIVVPYQTADLPQLKYTQSADTLFIVHPGYLPATLTRTSHIAWTYAPLSFLDGPYLDPNTTDNAVTPSGKTGSITLTWDTTAGINNGVGFAIGDVGRAVRVKLFSLWAWCVITAVTNDTTVTALVQAKVNDGASGSIDGAPWVGQTDYVTGAVVLGTDGVNLYQAKTPGRSASGTVGPQGMGSAILDGTIIWTALAARDAGSWIASTFYTINDVISEFGGSKYYQGTVSGKSDSGGSGPHGTAATQTEGTMTWAYLAPFVFPTKTKNWALGTWCPANGYPYSDRFWQERLFFGGYPKLPNQVIGSQVADFTNMAPTRADGTVISSNSVDWTIDDDQVNAIHSMIGAGSAQAMQLGMFTLAGEHVLQAASSSQALAPTSVQAYSETAYGSSPDVTPVRIGKAALFVDRTGRKLREWAFYWQSNGYEGPDLLKYSEHISRGPEGAAASQSGFAEGLFYQQAPHQVVWTVRKDGTLIGFTYDRNESIFAPHRHQLGGNYYGGSPVVESLSVIPSSDGTYDELWLAVLRTIGGVVTRTIEVMTPYFDGQAADDAFFVDCGISSSLTYPVATLTVTGLTNVNAAQSTLPVEFTGTAQLSTDADAFAATGDIVRANGGKLVITAVAGPRSATATALVALNNLAPAAPDDWSCTTPDSVFAGLGHLDGETVQVWGDGADIGSATVSGGEIALPNADKASYVTAGLPTIPVLVTMPWEPLRASAAVSQGKVKRVDHLYARFHETRGAKFGRRMTDPDTGIVEDKLEPWEDRQSSDLMDNAPPLFSGIRRIGPQGGYDLEGQLVFSRDGAGPLTVIGVFARGDVAEMPQP